ncbi:MAG: tRNA glutamyl-Q(34) synthetase GluQRS [Pseudomonadota bacterium]|nr:tRNA glutamyl-Q(34) synthetase GluQRS [Pseudomonadota bacterium]
MNGQKPADTVGRFAPSPTGPFHIGLLTAALGSYVAARAAGGRWLLRIEDIDTLRAVPGSESAILRGLEVHGLDWDGTPLRQSERTEAYAAALQRLAERGLLFDCACSRREIAAIAHAGSEGPIYPGTCRSGLPAGKPARARRVRVTDVPIAFEDGVQGHFQQDLARQVGDFVLYRADGVWAYQLAVVVDDIHQQVTQVARGRDLLTSTPRQIYLHHLLGHRAPDYLHLPLITDAAGLKVSKQTGAAPLDPRRAGANLTKVLRFLGQQLPPDLHGAPPPEQLAWATAHWQVARVPRQGGFVEPSGAHGGQE